MKITGTRYPGRKEPNGSANRNQQRYRPHNEIKQNETSSKLETSQIPKPPLQCWGCGEHHYYKNFPHRGRSQPVANVKEPYPASDLVQNIPQIKASLEDFQADYQPLIVELEGKISNHLVSILIDLGVSLSYISHRIFFLCHLKSLKFKNPWLVQLAIGAKRRVRAKIEH